MRQIMIATDGSEGAGRAVDVAANIAKATGSKLSILNVGGNLSGEDRSGCRPSRSKLLGAIRRRRSSKLPGASRWMLSWSADGAAGGLPVLLLGSVSQKVASLAPCIVLVVPIIHPRTYVPSGSTNRPVAPQG